MSIMDQVKQNLREWYSLAADRTGEMAKISVRMYDKYGISREIERQLSELGSYVYHAVEQGRTDFGGDQEFQAWIDRIHELDRDLAEKVEEIEKIRQMRQQKQAARDQQDPAAADTADDPDDAELLETREVDQTPAGEPIETPADDVDPGPSSEAPEVQPAEDPENEDENSRTGH